MQSTILFPIITVVVCSARVEGGSANCPDEFYDTGAGLEDCRTLCHPDNLDYVWDWDNCATLCPNTHQCIQTIAKTTAEIPTPHSVTPKSTEPEKTPPREQGNAVIASVKTSTSTLPLTIGLLVSLGVVLSVVVVVTVVYYKTKGTAANAPQDVESGGVSPVELNNLLPAVRGPTQPTEDGNTMMIPSGN